MRESTIPHTDLQTTPSRHSDGIKPPFLVEPGQSNLPETGYQKRTEKISPQELLEIQLKAATDQAMAEINSITEPQVQEALKAQEQIEIQKMKSAIMGKAKASENPNAVPAAEAKIAEFERIYRDEANADTVIGLLDKMTEKAGLESLDSSKLQIPAELENARFDNSPELQKAMLGQLRTEVEKLGLSVQKLDKLMKGMDATCGRIAKAYEEFSGTGNNREIYKALQTKMLLRVYQEKQSAKVSVGDHGINHLGWDTEVACKVAEDMGLTPMEQLYLDFAVDLHDIGYALPTIAREMQGGNFAIDQNHRIHSAKVTRGFMEKGILNGVFRGVKPLSVMERLALYHDQAAEINLHNPEEFSDAKIISCLAFADSTAVFSEEKLPDALVETPGVFLPALFELKIAKENYTRFERVKKLPEDNRAQELENIAESIRIKARNKILESKDYSDERKDELILNINQLQPDTSDYLVGRMMAVVDDTNPYGYSQELGKMYIRFTPASDVDIAGRNPLREMFGRVSVKQILKLATGLGMTDTEALQLLTANHADAARRQVRLYFNHDKVAQTPETGFNIKSNEVIQTLRRKTMQYEALQDGIKSLLVGPESNDNIVKRLNDSDRGKFFCMKLQKIAPDYFKRGDGIIEVEEAIGLLTNNEMERKLLLESLYNNRAKMAERIISGI